MPRQSKTLCAGGRCSYPVAILGHIGLIVAKLSQLLLFVIMAIGCAAFDDNSSSPDFEPTSIPAVEATISGLSSTSLPEVAVVADVSPTSLANEKLEGEDNDPRYRDLLPTVAPTPVRQAIYNILPYQPPNWSSSIIISDLPESNISSEISIDGGIYLTWAAINDSNRDIDHTFFVDMYLDGVLVERWKSLGLEAKEIVSVRDWDDLATRMTLSPGVHSLTLVVDPTDLVPETNESDNVLELSTIFSRSPDSGLLTISVPEKFPDLVPFKPKGWSDALIATSYTGEKNDGPLSVNVPSIISYGFRNQGPASIDSDMWVYIYLDEVLVSAHMGSAPLSEESVGSLEWNQLFDIIHVTPGIHTIRMEVDATNLVRESDENNNWLEKQFTWGTGGVNRSKPVLRANEVIIPPSPVLPNLIPGWHLGWDGPIIASSIRNSFLNGALYIDRTTFIDVVVHNQSSIGISHDFVVDLYLDDSKVHTFHFPDHMDANQLLGHWDWSGLKHNGQIRNGKHILKIIVDPNDAVKESNEFDNTYQMVIDWYLTDQSPALPIRYTTNELSVKLRDLDVTLATRELALSQSGKNYTERILQIADAGYYLLTGISLVDERVNIYLLGRQEYLDWIDDYYSEILASSNPNEYSRILAEQEKIRESSAGLKVPRFGKSAVVIDAERPIADVIGTLVHELGHMRQGLVNPAQDDSTYSSYQRKSLREAQAQQFEKAFWTVMEEFTGLELLKYPDYDGFRKWVSERLSNWLSNPGIDEHFQGYVIQWLSVLHDPALADLKQSLIANLNLSSAESLRMYQYLVELDPAFMDTYVDIYGVGSDDDLKTIGILARSRLISNMYQDHEGSPDLREVGLLMP